MGWTSALGRVVSRQLACPNRFTSPIMSRVFSRWNADVNAWVIDALDISPTEDVLEIGCGSGDAVALAAERAQSVTAIDRSAGMVSSTAGRNADAVATGRVTVVSHDVDEGIPVDDDSVDKAYGVHVVYFFRRPKHVMRECRRVLRPEGRLMLAFDTHRQAPSFVRDAFDSAGHRLYDEGSAAALLLSAGFKAVEVRNVPGRLHVVTGVCGKRRKREAPRVDPRWRLEEPVPESRRT